MNEDLLTYSPLHPLSEDTPLARLNYCEELGVDHLQALRPFVYRHEGALRPYAIFLLKRQLSLGEEEQPTEEEITAFLTGYRLERHYLLANEHEGLVFIGEEAE